MLLKHADVLRQLFPVELGGDHEADLEIEGAHLDAAQTRAQDLLTEMRPDQTWELLTDWERCYGLTPDPEAPLQARRDDLLAKIRSKGGLSIPYFIQLAASIGYTIEIEEPVPFMVDWSSVDETLEPDEILFVWYVTVTDISYYYFRVDSSCVDEPLSWGRLANDFEALFRDLKPAHTQVFFTYPEE